MYIWWDERPALFEEEKQAITQLFPELSFFLEDQNVYIRGELYIKPLDDSYSIEIEIPDDYPSSIPILRETGGEIPRLMDRHINGNGTCCVCVKPAERLHWPIGSSVVEYIQNLAIPFFINQYHYDATKKWINGDYSHGDKGVYEFYAEHLNELDPGKILNLLFETTSPLINKGKKCPCGSGRTFRKCHFDKVVFLKKNVDLGVLKQGHRAIRKLFPISIDMSK